MKNIKQRKFINRKLMQKTRSAMNDNNANLVFSIQLLYLFLSILWNVIGLWQISLGKQSIGPTASFMVIALLAGIAALLTIFHCKGYSRLYLILSILIAILATSAAVGAFTKPPSSWPSELFRYIGLAVNIIGISSFIALAKISAINSISEQ
jgi:hypothetical protein